MRFFPRLLLSHLLVIVLAVAGMLVCAELIAPAFYRDHVEQMAQQMGRMGGPSAELRRDLETGLRTTLTRALLASLPLAAGVALLTAWLVSRRLGRSVQVLQGGSRALALGEYGRRLPESGHDELSDLAHNFNVLAAALAQVEQGRVELIGNVAHELRAPLAALRGYADATNDGLLTPDHAARAITREVGAMERLVRDLSLVSRVEAGQVELHLETIDPAVLLRAVRERFAAPFGEKGVLLSVPDAPLPALQADAERVIQVLTNLLGNALRHTPAGGHVRVSTVREGQRLRFTVSDTGTGMSPEQLPRIFERFYRADPARSRQGGGSGVGLTIARGLVETMGGEMTVTSAPGRGSAFSFTLPTRER